MNYLCKECVCALANSTITAFKPGVHSSQTCNKCVLELSSCSELHHSHVWSKWLLFGPERVSEGTQTWHLQQLILLRVVVAHKMPHRDHISHSLQMCIAPSDGNPRQGGTLGIIPCLQRYFVLGRCLTIKHRIYKQKIEAEGRAQLCNHCSLVWRRQAEGRRQLWDHTHTGVK